MDLSLATPLKVVERLASLAQKERCPSLFVVYLAHANREGGVLPLLQEAFPDFRSPG
ncbi:MAG: hypothetical protein ACUVTO_10005 [Candidatus Caldatribacteriaceae bacterium]